MALSKAFITSAAVLLVALAAVTLTSTAPTGRTPTALAGPCADVPLIFPIGFGPPLNNNQGTAGDDEEDGIPPLYATTNKVYVSGTMEVDTVPSQLPDGKDPVTVTVVTTHPGITVTFNPDESDGSFDTVATVVVGDVEPGLYEFDVEVYCHELTTTYVLEVWVDMCPASSPFQSGVASNGDPWPVECTASEETPTPTTEPSETPDPSPTPTPTSSPGVNPLWGDINCDSAVNPVDSLLLLRFDANLPVNQQQPCPEPGDEGGDATPTASPTPEATESPTPTATLGNGAAGAPSTALIWGDIDCSGAVNPVDSLKTLRYDAGLSVAQDGDCPEIGEPVDF